MTVEEIRHLINEALADYQFVTVSEFQSTIEALRQQAVSENQLAETNAAVRRESYAREEHERRLARLESDVQAIDAKVAQVLEAMTAFKSGQSDSTSAIKSLRSEINSLSTVTESLLELSRQRNTAFEHVLKTQETQGELLANMSDESAERAKELVRMETAIDTLQQSALMTQNTVNSLESRFETFIATMTGVDTLVKILTSKRMQSILLMALAMLISAAFPELYTIVESVLQILGG